MPNGPEFDPDQIGSVILSPQSKPDDEQKRRDDTDEHPRALLVNLKLPSEVVIRR